MNLVKESWSEDNDSLENAIICSNRKADIWNREVFGNVFLKKKSLLVRLAGIQEKMSYAPSDFLVQLEKELTHEYEIVLTNERDLWFWKADWALEGERNTTLFHASTLVNRCWSKILGLKNQLGS